MTKGFKRVCVAVLSISLIAVGCSTQTQNQPAAPMRGSPDAPLPPIKLAMRPLIATAAAGSTPSVTLAWTPSTSPAAIGTRIYQGVVAGLYTNSIDAKAATNITISPLTQGVTYWFAAKAYNSIGVESDFSVPTSYTAPFPNMATNNVAVVHFYGEWSTNNQFTGWLPLTQTLGYWTNPPSPIFFRARMTIDYLQNQ